MSPRLKLRSVATPLAMAGALWTTTALTPVLGAGHGPIVNRGGAQTPPPCSPDGVCLPRPETFGVYQTRWRTFPGDVPVKAPTPAEQRAAEEPELGGPQLPRPTEEAQTGPASSRTPGAPGAADAEGAPAEGEEDAAAAGLGTLPGEAPLGGFELPGVAPQPGAGEGAEQPEGGPDPGAQPGPGAEPEGNPLEPFGNAPPAPPAWMTSAANRTAPQQSLAPLPVVEHAASLEIAPAPVATPTSVVVSAQTPATQNTPSPLQIQMPAAGSPNLHGDDAPPLLPPALASGVGAPARQAVAPAAAPAAVEQPPSSEPVFIDDQVEAASAEVPMGIQLVNPAAALVDPNAQGLQQAIYFEASDQ